MARIDIILIVKHLNAYLEWTIHLYKEYNESQERVISTAANAVHNPYPIPRICLVQGPPGTGKSYTIVGLVKEILNVSFLPNVWSSTSILTYNNLSLPYCSLCENRQKWSKTRLLNCVLHVKRYGTELRRPKFWTSVSHMSFVCFFFFRSGVKNFQDRPQLPHQMEVFETKWEFSCVPHLMLLLTSWLVGLQKFRFDFKIVTIRRKTGDVTVKMMSREVSEMWRLLQLQK